LYKHLYCSLKPEDEDMPAITIPISTIMDVLNAHERQQNALDIGHGKK